MWLEMLKRYIAILIIGVIIRELNKEAEGYRDSGLMIKKLLARLRPNYFSYSILILSVAMLLDGYHSFTLLSSAYIIVSLKNREYTALKLKPYQESIIIAIVNLLLAPAPIFLHSLLMMMILQLGEDLLQLEYDLMYGYTNFVLKYGKIEVVLAIGILLITGFMISWINTLIILPAIFMINYLYSI